MMEHLAAPETGHRRDAPAAPRVTDAPTGAVVGLQRAAGNRAVADLLAARTSPGARPSRSATGLRPLPAAGPSGVTPGKVSTVQRLALREGPPMAPGNYQYGSAIVSVEAGAMTKLLVGMAAKDGLAAERTWQRAFVTDMRGQTADLHSYDDPVRKQSVKVEPTLATEAEQGQAEVERQAGATQNAFQQQLLGSVRNMLDSSERKIEAEGRRYGFPDNESIFRPKPVSAGAATIAPSMPGGEETRGVIKGAKDLLDGKKKVKAARDQVGKLGPLMEYSTRPNILEPALKEYHELRQRTCGQFPILAAIERNETRLAEMAAQAAYTAGGATGAGAAAAMATAREELRKELADRLSSIAVVRSKMAEPDKIDKFWLNPALRENTKRSMAIAPSTLPNAAVEEKVGRLVADAEFEATLKTVIGTGLLILSFVPGVGLVAGAVRVGAGAAGLVMGAVDVYSAFQEFYWQEAAAGTAMEKAEAISQTDPSLFGLAVSLAAGLLEGVAEAKALEGAIGVFKAVRGAYREARAAAVAADVGSSAAKASGVAELQAASEKLRTTADSASGKPGLGDRLVQSLAADAKQTAKSLDRSLKLIKDPSLKELVLKDHQAVTMDGKTLMDLAIDDPVALQADFAEWQRNSADNPKASGNKFTDWVRDLKGGHQHDVLNAPGGVLEYGLDAAGAQRSFEATVREDPSREAGVWKNPASGEHVCVQGGATFVESGWMRDPDKLWPGKPRWELVVHHHPNRGVPIDRLPSPADFKHLAEDQWRSPHPQAVRSRITWHETGNPVAHVTEFGLTPGLEEPFWATYDVADGTRRTASFKTPPWAEGGTQYTNFVDAFTGKPTDPVPGGVIPEPPPTKR